MGWFVRTLAIVALLIAGGLPLRAQRPAPLPIRAGDTVVWLGDSITQQDLYTWYLETYWLTRFPTWPLRFRNAGWGGDTAWLRQRRDATHSLDEARLFGSGGPLSEAAQEALRRHIAFGLARDVLALKPTVVTIDFGMNDARGGDARIDAYAAALRELIRQLKSARVRVIVLSPSPEQRNQPGEPGGSAYNRMLARYSDRAAEVASAEGVPFINQLQPFLEVLRRGTQVKPTFNLVPDAVHPGPAGQLVMAWAILKGMNAPALVAEIAIDRNASAAHATGARVSDLSVQGMRVAFTARLTALPWYLPPETRPVWELTRIYDELDRFVIRIPGLGVGLWEVRVNGQPAGTVHAGELERGWNPLTVEASPLRERSRQIHDLVRQKNQAYFRLWRTPLGNNPPPADAWQAEAAQLTQRIAELERQIDALRRQPITFRFEFVPRRSS